MRGRTLLVDGVMVNKPYKSPTNDVYVAYYAGSIIFSTKYFQVYWDGNEHIDVYLWENYRGKVCGLCGNANGNSNDDFIGLNNSTSKMYKYKDWTDHWQNKNSKKMFVFKLYFI
jgi:hypothetical protein